MELLIRWTIPDNRFLIELHSREKRVHRQLDELNTAELSRLSVLGEGTQREQGGICVDLNQCVPGPFKTIGGQSAAADERIDGGRETDYELRNRLVGVNSDVEFEPPDTASDQSGATRASRTNIAVCAACDPPAAQ